MCRLIAADAQGMKDLLQVAGNHALTEEAVDSDCGCVILGQRDSIIGETQIDYRFADHSQFHQAGVRIAI